MQTCVTSMQTWVNLKVGSGAFMVMYLMVMNSIRKLGRRPGSFPVIILFEF